MPTSHHLKQAIRFGLFMAGLATSVSAMSAGTLPEVIVTAQKKSESIQDVPIAVTALSASDLTARGLDGGPDVLEAVPNVSFSKGNFTSFNLQIRGIGSKLIAGSGDQGVGIHLNNAPLAVSRFFEAEFYDIERIEVLRGPQGTVYGRNATGGVFNAITAKPTDKFESSVSLEAGNYETQKGKGMLNVPLGDIFSVRLATSILKRDGYVFDPVHNKQIDGRDLYAGRGTLGFKFSDAFNGFLMWEHFEENDDRQRAGKQLCTKDPGPTSVGGQSTTNLLAQPGQAPQEAQWWLTQGCLPGSIYSPAALSSINSSASLGGLLANIIGLQSGDAFAGKVVSSDLRTNESYYLPRYRAKSDIVELNLEFKPSDDLTLTSLTSWNSDRVESRQDYNRAVPTVNFNSIPGLAPGGVFADPQIGTTNKNSAFDISYSRTKTWTEELRLQSAFDGPINFNVGAIYMDLNSPVNGGYYVLFNTGSAYYLAASGTPTQIDSSPEPTGLGHNYYFNLQEYKLRSLAGFGELYWQMNDAFKWTLGLRYTDDRKDAVSYGIQHFLTPGYGIPPSQITYQSAQFRETTGRFGFDWKVGENNLLYAFYSRGYKGGGFNPSTAGNAKLTFDPEFVDAIEIGSKNTFADDTLQLNATAFYYDYNGYQISRIVNLTSVNDNIDAKIHGVELELAWQPLRDSRIDANIGYLKTEIQGGSSVDVMNRTQGDPTLTVVKGFSGTNCVIPTAAVAGLLTAINAPGSTTSVLAIPTLCNGPNAVIPGVSPSDGVSVSLDGKELPSAPHWTFNVGAQQSFNLDSEWRGTLRVDYYHQTDSFARFYNSEYDRVKGWTNVNLSLAVDNSTSGWNWLFYVKNLLGDDNITDSYLTDDSSGLWTNTFLTDPRLVGLSITKKF